MNHAKSYLASFGSKDGIAGGEQAESFISDTQFTFDEELVNTRQYRQVLIAANEVVLRNTPSPEHSRTSSSTSNVMSKPYSKNVQNTSLSRAPLQSPRHPFEVQGEPIPGRSTSTTNILSQEPGTGIATQESDTDTTTMDISFSTAFENWQVMYSGWENVTTSWARRLEQSTLGTQKEPAQEQVAQHVTEMSRAGHTLSQAASEMQNVHSKNTGKARIKFERKRSCAEESRKIPRRLQSSPWSIGKICHQIR